MCHPGYYIFALCVSPCYKFEIFPSSWLLGRYATNAVTFIFITLLKIQSWIDRIWVNWGSNKYCLCGVHPRHTAIQKYSFRFDCKRTLTIDHKASIFRKAQCISQASITKPTSSNACALRIHIAYMYSLQSGDYSGHRPEPYLTTLPPRTNSLPQSYRVNQIYKGCARWIHRTLSSNFHRPCSTGFCKNVFLGW